MAGIKTAKKFDHHCLAEVFNMRRDRRCEEMVFSRGQVAIEITASKSKKPLYTVWRFDGYGIDQVELEPTTDINEVAEHLTLINTYRTCGWDAYLEEAEGPLAILKSAPDTGDTVRVTRGKFAGREFEFVCVSNDVSYKFPTAIIKEKDEIGYERMIDLKLLKVTVLRGQRKTKIG